jgi:hypothetical protein
VPNRIVAFGAHQAMALLGGIPEVAGRERHAFNFVELPKAAFSHRGLPSGIGSQDPVELVNVVD